VTVVAVGVDDNEVGVEDVVVVRVPGMVNC
jgi:hypothetical protein